MNSYDIQLIETTLENNGIKCQEYGLLVSNGNVTSHVPGISRNKTFVLDLLAFCRKHKASPIHIKDVVEDYLVRDE